MNGTAEKVAPRLLGCVLERELDGVKLRARIVETEAYDQGDIASHSYNGETPRTKVMFGPSGRLYVYFTYGMHYCCNVVTGPTGYGSAVLIRAVEPLSGQENMVLRRGGKNGMELTNGPAKLCQAFAIDKSLNGHRLTDYPLKLIAESAVPPDSIVRATRIGIREGVELLWRFYLRGNPYVSKT